MAFLAIECSFSGRSTLVRAYEGTDAILVSTLPCHLLWHRIPFHYTRHRGIVVRSRREHRTWTAHLIGFRGY